MRADDRPVFVAVDEPDRVVGFAETVLGYGDGDGVARLDRLYRRDGPSASGRDPEAVHEFRGVERAATTRDDRFDAVQYEYRKQL